MQKIGLWVMLLSLMIIQSVAMSEPLYGPVKEGQSLWNIAKEIRTDSSVTLQQLSVALWLLNPQAFSQPCNPNSLKIKVSLQIPDKAKITALSPKEAVAVLQRTDEELKQIPPCFSTSVLNQPPVSLPPDSEGLSWLELGTEVLKNWKAEISPENNSVMTITPTQWEKTTEPLSKKILGLIPKQSDSYSLASSKLLQVLYDEGIYASITLINFNKDDGLGKAAIQLAEQEKMDLIFSMGSESAAFLHEFYDGGRIPVVTCTNKDPVLLHQIADYDTGSGTNIAYTSLNVPIDIQVNYLTDLIPGLKNLGILYDRNHAQVVATEVLPTKDKLHKMGINVIDIEVTSAETAKDDLLKNIPAAISLMQQSDPNLRQSVFWVTSSTLVFSNMATVMQVGGTIPVLGSIPNIVTEGNDSAVMAIGIDRRNNAYLASIYAVKILKGEAQAGQLKVGVVTPPDIAINFQAARKVNLDIPFHLFESASFIYGYTGKPVRSFGHDNTTQK